jgi:hypothetical protein
MDMDALLNSCILHLDGTAKEVARLRGRLASLPWDILDERGKGSLAAAREHLLGCEGKLDHAKKQIALQVKSVKGG